MRTTERLRVILERSRVLSLWLTRSGYFLLTLSDDEGKTIAEGVGREFREAIAVIEEKLESRLKRQHSRSGAARSTSTKSSERSS
jgi:hypothetical protein